MPRSLSSQSTNSCSVFPKTSFTARPGFGPDSRGQRGRIGLSDFTQQRNGDAAFAEPKDLGKGSRRAKKPPWSRPSRSISAFRRLSAGKIVEVNRDLLSSPELVNQDPYGKGWLAVIEVEEERAARKALMTAADYFALARTQAEAEVPR